MMIRLPQEALTCDTVVLGAAIRIAASIRNPREMERLAPAALAARAGLSAYRWGRIHDDVATVVAALDGQRIAA